MHISEGVLSTHVLLTGALLSAGGVAAGLRKMPYERIPEVAVLCSAFFVASLIRVPVGPASVHLALNGLLGLLLGWMAFPCILVALTLQAVLFQFGGFSTLGINTFNMAAPAVIVHYLFNTPARSENRFLGAGAGFLSGAAGVGIGALLIALSLISTEEGFLNMASVLVLSHLPVMFVEGALTAFIVLFLIKVKPEMLKGGQ